MKLKSFLSFMMLLFALILYAAGEVLGSFHVMKYALLILYISLIWRYGNRDNAPAFSFLICFGIFLLGRIFISLIDPLLWINLDDNRTVMLHTHRCLVIALVFFGMGASYGLFRIRLVGGKRIETDSSIRYVRSAALCLFYISSICKTVELAEKASYVLFSGGYLSYYTSFISSIPGAVRKIADLNEAAFFAYLGTMPDPRRKMIPFIAFLMFGVLTLMYGQRNGIITAVIIVAVYVILYENANHIRYQIIPKRIYTLAFLSLPLLAAVLDMFNMLRSGTGFQLNGLFASMINFFSNVGNSIRVISYGYYFSDKINPDRLYSFGTVIHFLKSNIIIQILSQSRITVFDAAVAQSSSSPLDGYAFSYVVTYLYSPNEYLAGHGMGSCYIAEAFHDFGYTGVAIFSLVYGRLLGSMKDLLRKGWITNTILLMSCYNLLLTPRDTACKFLASIINYQFVLMIFLVFLISSVLRGQ